MAVKLGLIQSEGHSLRVFENWLLRRIFGPKRVEEVVVVVVGDWRRLHNEKLYNFSSPNSTRVI
jgi:hypothetical protein